MTKMMSTLINGKWALILPEHRAVRPEWKTGWEVERIDAMHEFLKPGMSIIDVGAEEGDMPALWASWGCDVFVVEPNPKVWPNIRAIWDHNDLKPLIGYFVGFASASEEGVTNHSEDDLRMVSPVDPDWPVCAFGPLIGDHGFRHLAQERDVTPQAPIDVLLQRGPIDCITMDIEGSELRALTGARYTLTDYHPEVFVSVHEEVMLELYGDTPAQLHGYMESLGYKGTHLATDHEAHWQYSWVG